MSQFFLFKQWFKGPLLSVEVPASLIAQLVKNQPSMQEIWVPSLGQEVLWRREWVPTPVFLPGKFHRLKRLVGYSPWGCKELDMTDKVILNLEYVVALYS